MPDTTRIGRSSRDIGIWPPSTEQRAELVLVGSAEDPDQREIDDHPAADDRHDSGQAMPDRSGEPVGEDHPDDEQGRDHCRTRDQLPDNPRGEPALDAEMAAAMENHVEDDAIEPRA